MGVLWLKDDYLEESGILSEPSVLIAEIIEDHQTALEQFRELLE